MRIVDLSQDIYEGMKVYPGHLKTVQFEHATHEETAPRFEGGFSFQTTGFMLNDNGPTHVDSFSHLDPDPSAQSIDQMPLDLFYGTAVCLDVSGFQPRTDITADDLEKATPKIQPGDIVIVPAGVVHGWLDIPEHVDYLSFRPSPGILTAGWVHPVLKK